MEENLLIWVLAGWSVGLVGWTVWLANCWLHLQSEKDDFYHQQQRWMVHAADEQKHRWN